VCSPFFSYWAWILFQWVNLQLQACGYPFDLGLGAI